MRTVRILNAEFAGDYDREAAWFGVSASIPGVTIGGERAARQIDPRCGAAKRNGCSPRPLCWRRASMACFPG